MNDTPTAAPTGTGDTQALCVCDHACPMTEDHHWVNCPAHAYYAAYIAQVDGRDRAARAERDSARHCLADHIVGDQMKDNGTLFVNSEQAVSAIVRFAAIRQDAATSTAQDGYATAFYEIATMLGISARAASPADVWRDQMRPKLEALAAGQGDGTASIKRDGQFLLDRLVDHEARMTSEQDAREWHGHVTPAMARFRVSLADIVKVGPVRTSRFDPPGLWESEPRPSADDAGKGGQ